MKMMFNLMTECAEQLQQYLDKPARNGDILEMKDVMAHFTNDVTGSCFFGINCNSFTDSNSEFCKMAKLMFEPSLKSNLRTMLRTFPSFLLKLLKLFHVRVLPEEIINFCTGAVNDVIEYREKNNVVRNDFMQLLIQLKNKGKIEDDGDIESEHVQDGKAGRDMEENIGECITYVMYWCTMWQYQLKITKLKSFYFIMGMWVMVGR
jgi:cytochrome P450 family 6